MRKSILGVIHPTILRQLTHERRGGWTVFYACILVLDMKICALHYA